MPTNTETNYADDVIMYEADSRYSRDTITLSTAANLGVGTVLGKITASGLYVILAPGAADGSQYAVAILLTPANGSNVKATALTRHAEVADSFLVWPGGITAPQKTAAIAQLAGAANGVTGGAIVVRTAA